MIEYGEKYITIGDDVINTQKKIIGRVTLMKSSTVDESILYRININHSKSKQIFGECGVTEQLCYCSINGIEPIQPIQVLPMYSKKKNNYKRPIFKHIKKRHIKIFNKVRIIDNDYIKNTIEKLNSVNINLSISTKSPNWSYFDDNFFSIFDLKYNIVNKNVCGSNLVECVHYSKYDYGHSIYVPYECLVIEKNYNFFTRIIEKFLNKGLYE